MIHTLNSNSRSRDYNEYFSAMFTFSYSGRLGPRAYPNFWENTHIHGIHRHLEQPATTKAKETRDIPVQSCLVLSHLVVESTLTLTH